MGIGTGGAALIGGIGSLAGGALSANAANNAASKQAAAANNAANLDYQASQNALGFQENQFNTEQADLQPWLQSGAGALSQLDYLTGNSPQPIANSATVNPTTSSTNALVPQSGARTQSVAIPGQTSPTAATTTPAAFSSTPPSSSASGGYGSLLTPYSQAFTAPTAQEALNSPGEQAQLQLGEQALQQSAAARGNLLTGGTAEAVNNYAQQLASTNYQNVYNDAYNTYAAGYNQYENQQANTFNRLSALAGGGQTAANTLGTLGQSASNSVSNNLLGTASAMGQQGNNAAAANASGLVGSANAYSGAIGNTTSNLSQLALLQQLYGGSSSGNPYQTLANQSNPYANGSNLVDTEDSSYGGYV